ncbi:hypothetical protein O181_079055 [Austropuccinia psidii MF-1]|uniref:Uncharacterized protein n=1 Tax=Austropuccinia psidii MF-1 TaxID=1389203 RepID=A0A9Q3FE23_9BASI|nr:hypothetical protein [Austropuccinia psidii MF-1]
MEVQGCTNAGSREIYSSTEVINSSYINSELSSHVQPLLRKNQNLVVTHYYQFTQPTPYPVPKFEPRPSPIPATTRQPTMASLTRQSSIPTKTNIQPITAPSSNTRAEGSQLPFPASKVVQSRGL